MEKRGHGGYNIGGRYGGVSGSKNGVRAVVVLVAGGAQTSARNRAPPWCTVVTQAKLSGYG